MYYYFQSAHYFYSQFKFGYLMCIYVLLKSVGNINGFILLGQIKQEPQVKEELIWVDILPSG